MPFSRAAGILLQPTSLPGPYGIGELGREVFAWLDFLEAAGQRLWQVMPLGPTGYGDSPYQSFSAFAGNPYLISLERLVEESLLPGEALEETPDFPNDRVDFGAVIPFKLESLTRAYEYAKNRLSAEQAEAFVAYKKAKRYWLEDYALFMALKDQHGGRPWSEWAPELRTRDAAALEKARAEHRDATEKHRFWQWLFDVQWGAVKGYANARGIDIIGDIPIFIAYDSADAWANPELFYFSEQAEPTVVAGVPPDYFSETGQRWGNPLYRWEEMRAQGFSWWIQRFESTLEFVDIVRIDHFRGFEAYWEIPAGEPTAVKGRWVEGPGQALFDALRAALGDLPVIAEDLGVITPGVEALRDNNDLPGMKVLQFAFAGDASDPYLPHNYAPNSVVYTGTHDNDTTCGWYDTAPEAERDFLRRYLARSGDNIAWELLRLANASVANLALSPMQDVLGLGAAARMNTPGVAAGNWTWRFTWQQVEPWLAPQLRELVELYGRLPSDGARDTPYRQSVLSGETE